ncbi:MAG TPA: hypothetical protein VFK32_07860 [Tepidiformaceae bacterium]|nr:hypothetical protein [Tepidiformaceae bacterium]
MTPLESVAKQALVLTDDERAELIVLLRESLGSAGFEVDETYWASELSIRRADARTSAGLVPADEALSRIFAQPEA